ncbi:uncharacterized protein LOC141679182 [Apium graveolens]|uniref:uncharacterized protein LOC141679182 n=1 Tax=Apium graveolens TaxID=4045 RepID=UPI003D7BEA78
MNEANGNSTYLGLPSTLGKNKSALLGYLKDKATAKIKSWDGNYISRSGKEVLIKSVAQTLPTYAMNVFLLPFEITKYIEKTLSNFWWKTSQKKNSGAKIKIVGQPWLANNDSPYITTDFQELEGRTVASLFQNGNSMWDLDIIKSVFNDRDQQLILDTIVSDNNREDELYWLHEASGLYSVKSAYRWLQQKTEAWRSADRASIFTKLWKIKAPPKCINVAWRALIHCLPTLVQLQIKRVDTHGGTFSNFATWLEYVLASASLKIQAEIITLCWTIWRNRNDIVWNQRFSSVNRIVAAAKQYLTQWSIAQNRSTNTLLQPIFEGDGDCIWVNPQQNSVKVSVDATVFEDKDAAGLGLVVRDDKGVLLQAKTILWPSPVAPVRAEAMAVKEALSWIDGMQWPNVTLVSDCLVVIQAIRSKTPMRSQFGSILEDCRSYLRRLNKISLYHVKRSANMVAHTLARKSYNYPGRSFDRNSIPRSVKHCDRCSCSWRRLPLARVCTRRPVPVWSGPVPVSESLIRIRFVSLSESSLASPLGPLEKDCRNYGAAVLCAPVLSVRKVGVRSCPTSFVGRADC